MSLDVTSEPAITITRLPHDPRLARLVIGYWFIEDLAGLQAGSPITTCPFPGAVLSVNIGRPNAMVDGPTVPRVGLLGLHERCLSWRSWKDTAFFMACLTAEGLASVLPDTGPSTVGRLIDVGALVGDAAAGRLSRSVAVAPDPVAAARGFDLWLLRRLHAQAPGHDVQSLSVVARALSAGRSVDEAAALAGTTRRQLHRWHVRHLGLGPARLRQLIRLQGSVRDLQQHSDGMTGFADQAHQVRCWKRAFGMTPGAYRRLPPSLLASRFPDPAAGLSFYL